ELLLDRAPGLAPVHLQPRRRHYPHPVPAARTQGPGQCRKTGGRFSARRHLRLRNTGIRLMFKHMVLLLLLTAATAPAVADQLLDRTVAIVNDDVILQSELDAELRQISAQLQKRGVALPPQNIFVQQVLQRMVINKLQLQRAELGGIVISDDMLNQYLSRIAQQNGLTLADLPAAMARDGVNYADYREDLRKQATIDTLQRIDVLQRISVSDREIDSYLAAQDDG